MGCSNCSVDQNGTPRGCGDKGHCTSGSCNKHNSYDWINARDIYDPSAYNYVEVSFKKGSHKEFFINEPAAKAITGDMVVVETTSGYDIGRISLSGELVRLQMKKRKTSEDRVSLRVLRKANERDLEKLNEARHLEQPTLVKSRVIARTLGLDMKLGDIEYQGDKKKATFYYTAEGRVDFRELVKEYAREFKVKIEMRQIGARQESARIGGIGSCGRELCCSTWLSDFKSVNTAAARYQNIAINQSKLSGQCGRLKCCLNYELDTYMDALGDFPDDVEHLNTKQGRATLVKTDIFKGLFYYIVDNEKMRGQFIPVYKERVKEIKALNLKGVYPPELVVEKAPTPIDRDSEDTVHEYEDVTGLIELKNDPKKKKKKKKPNPQSRREGSDAPTREGQSENRPQRERNANQGPRPDQPRREGQQPRPPRPERQQNEQNPATDRPQNQGPSPQTTSTQPTGESGTNENRPQGGGNKNKKKKFFKNKNKGGGPAAPPQA
jgi:cell fate regulator YaaT (PSP1 superfamily)